MEFLTRHRFNSVRFFFNAQAVVQNLVVPEHVYNWGSTDMHHLDYAPHLVGLTYVEMLKQLVQDMARHGIQVMIAMHRLTARLYPGARGSGKWYADEAGMPLERVKHAWTALADALCGEWNVFAADVQNEPFASSWGFGGPGSDWRLGAEDLGNHILSVCPRWLIMRMLRWRNEASLDIYARVSDHQWEEQLAGALGAQVDASLVSRLPRMDISPEQEGAFLQMAHALVGADLVGARSASA